MEMYPVFFKLEQQPVLVVGGGRVAYRKIKTLAQAGAHITIISPEVTSGLAQFIEEHKIEWRQREYRAGDLAGYLLVVAATDKREVNLSVYTEAQQLQKPVNVVDQPDLCSFYLSARVSRGRLQLAISTSGASPGLAGQIRRRLSEEFGPAFKDYLALMDQLRPRLIAALGEEERRPLFKALGGQMIFNHLYSGELAAAVELVQKLIPAPIWTELEQEGKLDHIKQAERKI